MLLEENGSRVLTVTSGKDALQVFASNPVDLVLFDPHMPRMNNGDVTAIHMRAASLMFPSRFCLVTSCCHRVGSRQSTLSFPSRSP